VKTVKFTVRRTRPANVDAGDCVFAVDWTN
jgi:hypothetical protein